MCMNYTLIIEYLCISWIILHYILIKFKRIYTLYILILKYDLKFYNFCHNEINILIDVMQHYNFYVTYFFYYN